MRNPLYEHPVDTLAGVTLSCREVAASCTLGKNPVLVAGDVSCCCVVFARAQTPKATLSSPGWTRVISALLSA
jgi:hypothetical protein